MDAGFTRAVHGATATSHERWKHPSGSVVGLTNPDRKDSVGREALKQLYDALIYAAEWDKGHEKAAKPSFPTWLTDELLGDDGITLVRQTSDTDFAILVDKNYPECVAVVPIVDLDKARYISVVRGLRADVTGYVGKLDALQEAFDIERIKDGSDHPLLRVNGSGKHVAIPFIDAAGDNAIRLKNEHILNLNHALYEAEAIATQDAQVHKEAGRLVGLAEQKLADIACVFESGERGARIARVPRHLADRSGHKFIAIAPHISLAGAERLLQTAGRMSAYHSDHIRRQNEILGDVQHYGCTIDMTVADRLRVTQKDGAETDFHRDRAGCVDIAEIRAFSHMLRDRSWVERSAKSAEQGKSPLRS